MEIEKEIMKKRKVIIKAVLVLALLSPLNFNSCKKSGCWNCFETNIVYSMRVCDEAAKDSYISKGYTCYEVK
jgi:hypothetical protein